MRLMIVAIPSSSRNGLLHSFLVRGIALGVFQPALRTVCRCQPQLGGQYMELDMRYDIAVNDITLPLFRDCSGPAHETSQKNIVTL
jgi:hypothetical protein